jgi:hypothetical protein
MIMEPFLMAFAALAVFSCIVFLGWRMKQKSQSRFASLYPLAAAVVGSVIVGVLFELFSK